MRKKVLRILHLPLLVTNPPLAGARPSQGEGGYTSGRRKSTDATARPSQGEGGFVTGRSTDITVRPLDRRSGQVAQPTFEQVARPTSPLSRFCAFRISCSSDAEFQPRYITITDFKCFTFRGCRASSTSSTLSDSPISRVGVHCGQKKKVK